MKNRYLLLVFLSLFIQRGASCSEVFFSPNGGVRDQIIKRINLSKSSIDVAVYSFTAGEVAQALADAHKRGVKIRVIRDKTQSSNKDDENSFLMKQGISVKILKGKGRGIMHDKFAIFDGKEAFTGSYNWTENAEKFNYENALFIDDPNVIEGFKNEFEGLWNPTPKSQKH